MNFDHFYNLAGLDAGDIGLLWRSGSSFGDYTLNSAADTISYSVDLENDFTCFMTFDHRKSVTNNGPVPLISNYYTGASYSGGWMIGIDDANFLFLKTFFPTSEAYTFDQITLGRKNCLAFKVQGNNFTTYRYETPFSEISQIQSKTINPSRYISGGDVYIGSYMGNPVSGMEFFYGTFDQVAMINQPLSQGIVNKVFSGFLPITVSTGSAADFNLREEKWSYSNTGVSQTDFDVIEFSLHNINDEFLSSAETGVSYGGYVEIDSTTESSLYYFGLKSGCSYTSDYFFDNDGVSTLPDGFPGKVLTGSVDHYINNSGYAFLSYEFSVSGSTYNPTGAITIHYEGIYQFSSAATDYSYDYDQNYNTGFKMNGVQIGSFYDDTIYLQTANDNPSKIAISAPFDFAKGLFRFNSGQETGSIYFNKIYLNPNNAIFNGGYIDNVFQTETSADTLVYDNTDSGWVDLANNTASYVTGDFYAETSRLFDLDGRTTNYLETHSYHLYHAKDITFIELSGIYINSNKHWT